MKLLKPNRYVVIDVEQGSEEWHKLRASHIGASESAIIMDESPYMTPFQFWQRKLNKVPAQEQTNNMRAGKEREPIIREFVEKEVGFELPPKVIKHKDCPWILASLDGFNEGKKVLLEAKLNKKEYHEMARKEEVPRGHYIQMQHQLMLSGAEYCIYASMNSEGEIIWFKVMPNETAMEEIITADEEFWTVNLAKDIAPELTERDFMVREDKEFEELEEKFYELYQTLKPAIEAKEALAEKLKNLCEKSSKGNKVKISCKIIPGCIDYKKIVEDFKIDVTPYQKPSKVSKRIDVI